MAGMKVKFQQLMDEEETRDALTFFFNLEKKDLLVYTALVKDIHKHKVEEGNSATDMYVKRKYAELIEQNKELKTEMDKNRGNKEMLGTISETMIDIQQSIETIEARDKQVKTATAIGQEGEEWVLHALQEAFPSPFGQVERTATNNCGDITLTYNNQRIMFEVKNCKGGTVKGQNKGKEIQKFFADAEHISDDGDRFNAAVLVSLKSPVDSGVPSLSPQVHKPSNIPYLYVDNARDTADPITLFRAVVSIMVFMVEHVETSNDSEIMVQKIKVTIPRIKGLQVTYEEMHKNHNNGTKVLGTMKNQIVELLQELGEPSKTPNKRTHTSPMKSVTPQKRALQFSSN